MNTVELKIEALKKKQLSDSEKAVMAVLYPPWKDKVKDYRVTQAQIAKSERWLGCHKKYESDKVRNKQESTLRQVRQIIHDLRVEHHAPILSDTKGYWIPQSEFEAREFFNRFEGETKAHNKIRFDTYKVMRDTFGFTSTYFEGQEKLL